MEDDPTRATDKTRRGDDADVLADTPADVRGSSGWVTTKVAAEALGVNPRTVRGYIGRGDLEARSEGEGIQKAYLVSIDSVYALRDRRGTAAKQARSSRAGVRGESAESADFAGPRGSAVGTSGEAPAEDIAGVIRDLAADLARMSAEAAEFKTRLELTANAESTLREQLAREQARADRLEAELLEARRTQPGPRDASEAATEPPSGTETPADDTGQPRRSWWRRFFGFD